MIWEIRVGSPRIKLQGASNETFLFLETDFPAQNINLKRKNSAKEYI